MGSKLAKKLGKEKLEDGSNGQFKALARMDLKMYREHLALVVKTEHEL